MIRIRLKANVVLSGKWSTRSPRALGSDLAEKSNLETQDWEISLGLFE